MLSFSTSTTVTLCRNIFVKKPTWIMQKKLLRQINQTKLLFNTLLEMTNDKGTAEIYQLRHKCHIIPKLKGQYKHKCKQHQDHKGSPFKKHKSWNCKLGGGPSKYNGDISSRGDSKHWPGFCCPAQKFKCQNCHKTGHFTHCCFKKATPKYKDKPHSVHGITIDCNDNISHSSSSDGSDQESTLSHESFFVGTIQATATTKSVTKMKALYSSLTYLLPPRFTTNIDKCCTWKQILVLWKNVMTKKIYVSLTGDKSFKELDPWVPPKRIWSRSPNTKFRNMELLPVEWQKTLWSYISNLIGKRWTNIIKQNWQPLTWIN